MRGVGGGLCLPLQFPVSYWNQMCPIHTISFVIYPIVFAIDIICSVIMNLGGWGIFCEIHENKFVLPRYSSYALDYSLWWIELTYLCSTLKTVNVAQGLNQTVVNFQSGCEGEGWAESDRMCLALGDVWCGPVAGGPEGWCHSVCGRRMGWRKLWLQRSVPARRTPHTSKYDCAIYWLLIVLTISISAIL